MTEPGSPPLAVSTQTVLDHVERWAAVYRTMVGVMMVAVAALVAPELVTSTLAYAALAAGIALYAHRRPNSLTALPKVAFLTADMALVTNWCLALPEEPFVPAQYSIIVLAWSVVYGPRWGLLSSVACTALYLGVRWVLGDAPHELVATTAPMGFVLVSTAATIAGLLGQLRGEWTRTRQEERRRRAESEAHADEVTRLAGTVAHEMNNSLTAILGLASLMEQDTQDERMLGDLEAVVRACRDGQRQVENLLGVAGRGELVLVRHEARDLVRQAIQPLHRALPPDVGFDLQVGRGLPPVLADASALARALVNVGLNAVEATGQQPMTVRVAVSAVRLLPGEDEQLGAGDWVRIDVQDDGPGFDASAQDVWDPRFTTKSRPEPAGLGLSHVQRVARRHLGLARLRSSAGEGTTVTLWLPADGPAPSLSDSSTPLGVPHPRVVLLVEDDPVVERAITRMLHHLDHDVLSARTASEAIDLARRHRTVIGHVLCDLGLPDMDGAELISVLRTDLPEARIVVASGRMEPNLRGQLLARGADGFLPKPFGGEELAAAVGAAPGATAAERVQSAP